MSDQKKSPREESQDMMNDPNKKKSEARDVTCRLWRQMTSLTINSYTGWLELVEAHLKSLMRYLPLSTQDVGTEKGNLTKNFIQKKYMTMKMLEKGMRLLGFVRMRVILQGFRDNDEVVETAVDVQLVKKSGKAANTNAADMDQMSRNSMEIHVPSGTNMDRVAEIIKLIESGEIDRVIIDSDK